eukprot:4032533-Pleurochrysis_carterae.AAC.1
MAPPSPLTSTSGAALPLSCPTRLLSLRTPARGCGLTRARTNATEPAACGLATRVCAHLSRGNCGRPRGTRLRQSMLTSSRASPVNGTLPGTLSLATTRRPEVSLPPLRRGL